MRLRNTVQAMDLCASLRRAAGSLGVYLPSKEKHRLNNYALRIERMKISFAHFKSTMWQSMMKYPLNESTS